MVLSFCALISLDQLEDHRHLVHAHAGGRLVEHEDLGLEREQDRHLELALVAVRQLGGERVAPLGERDARAGSARRARSARRGCSTSRAGSGPCPARACTARRTFSSTVRFGNRLVSWKARPMPLRVRTRRGIARHVLAEQQHLPGAAGSCPEIRLK